MKIKINALPFTFFLLIMISQLNFAQERTNITLKKGWKFLKGISENAFHKDFDDSDWQTVSVPHDWAIYGPFDKEVDKQLVAIVQNNENVASEKTEEQEPCLILVKVGIETNLRFPNTKKDKKYCCFLKGQ